jgi:hypothetical protein
VEASKRTVVLEERQHSTRRRPHEHPRKPAPRVVVLAEDVADARAVPGTDRPQRGRRERWASVDDDEVGVVLDPLAEIERPDEVVDLLAGRPRSSRAQPELLVEVVDGPDDGRPEEDRERDRAVPQVPARQGDGVSRPRRS